MAVTQCSWRTTGQSPTVWGAAHGTTGRPSSAATRRLRRLGALATPPFTPLVTFRVTPLAPLRLRLSPLALLILLLPLLLRLAVLLLLRLAVLLSLHSPPPWPLSASSCRCVCARAPPCTRACASVCVRVGGRIDGREGGTKWTEGADDGVWP